MKAQETVPIKVGNYRATLPVHESEATSREIVDQVEAYHAIVREKISSDTVTEVLWVAYEFAWDAHRLRQELKTFKSDLKTQDDEIIDDLHKLLTRVRKTVHTYTTKGEEEKPKDKGPEDPPRLIG